MTWAVADIGWYSAEPIFFPFSIMVFYRILDIVSCAVQ